LAACALEAEAGGVWSLVVGSDTTLHCPACLRKTA
jgi:hypothetical protein